MKKILLLFCVFPYFLNAQMAIDKQLKENPISFQLVKKHDVESRASLDPISTTNRPDTIYAYEGEDKRRIYMEALTYDEDGRLKSFIYGSDTNGDGIFNQNDEMFQRIYTYTYKGDSIIEENYLSEYKNNESASYIKEVCIFQKSSGIQIGHYLYSIDDDLWKVVSENVSTEFNEKGLPVVKEHKYFSTDPDLLNWNWTEITYNEKDLVSIEINYHPVKIEENMIDTIPSHKKEYLYDDKRLIKEISYSYNNIEEKWYNLSTIEYLYDEKGNLISETHTNQIDGRNSQYYYEYIYSSTVSNDEIISVYSVVYPNPVSDVLNVTIDGAEQAVITLINANGSIVAQQKIQQSTASIPVNMLAKGYYFLTVQTAKGTKTHKVIIK